MLLRLMCCSSSYSRILFCKSNSVRKVVVVNNVNLRLLGWVMMFLCLFGLVLRNVVKLVKIKVVNWVVFLLCLFIYKSNVNGVVLLFGGLSCGLLC